MKRLIVSLAMILCLSAASAQAAPLVTFNDQAKTPGGVSLLNGNITDPKGEIKRFPDVAPGTGFTGWAFQNGQKDLIVDQLGYYDYNPADGLTGTYQVSLYEMTKNITNSADRQFANLSLLASVTINSSDVLVTSTLGSAYRMESVNPLTLDAGKTFVVLGGVGIGQNTRDLNVFAQAPATLDFPAAISSDINYLGGVTYTGPFSLFGQSFDIFSFNDPQSFGTFGPMLSGAPVPVPAALWLLGSGLLGLVGLRRRG